MLLSELVPRAAIIILLFLGAVFTYFESVYLQDQAAEIGSDATKILLWMWVFRLVTLVFTFVAFLLFVNTAKRYMN